MTRMQKISLARRRLLQASGSVLTLAATLGLGLLPARARAGASRPAFEARTQAAALQQLGAESALESPDIFIKAPQLSENGAFVPLEVTSNIPGTSSISVLVEKNRYPLIATFRFGAGVEAFVSTRIKMAETSAVRAVVQADGKFYTAATEVMVILGGCG